jgi:hypothetical protein
LSRVSLLMLCIQKVCCRSTPKIHYFDWTINRPFKSTFLIYKFILKSNERCLGFATSSFNLNILFSSILSICELCQRRQCSCLVYILEISECCISRISQNLEFIFRVPIRNIIMKNGQNYKMHTKFHLNLWLYVPISTETKPEIFSVR